MLLLLSTTENFGVSDITQAINHKSGWRRSKAAVIILSRLLTKCEAQGHGTDHPDVTNGLAASPF